MLETVAPQKGSVADECGMHSIDVLPPVVEDDTLLCVTLAAY